MLNGKRVVCVAISLTILSTWSSNSDLLLYPSEINKRFGYVVISSRVISFLSTNLSSADRSGHDGSTSTLAKIDELLLLLPTYCDGRIAVICTFSAFET